MKKGMEMNWVVILIIAVAIIIFYLIFIKNIDLFRESIPKFLHSIASFK